jgi:hypothetical protein
LKVKRSECIYESLEAQENIQHNFTTEKHIHALQIISNFPFEEQSTGLWRYEQALVRRQNVRWNSPNKESTLLANKPQHAGYIHNGRCSVIA